MSWRHLLTDYMPIRNLATAQDGERWEGEIDRILRRIVSADELDAAVKWAAANGRIESHTSFEPPTPRDVAMWVRLSAESVLPARGDAARRDRVASPAERKALSDVLRAWNERNRADAKPKTPAGDGYRLLQAGEPLAATDEFWNGSAWVAYGRNAVDAEGHARRLTVYRQTVARRRVVAEVTP